jgi:hypothetical protein
MNTAFLAAAAAGLAGLGFGIHGQTAQVQIAHQVLSASDHGEDAGVFSRWLTPDSLECVPVSKIGLGSRSTNLSPDQFQFVRALYVAIPPTSRELPPGKSAIVASADGKAMIALVADGKACARFLTPDFILSMLVQVGRSETGKVGEAI